MTSSKETRSETRNTPKRPPFPGPGTTAMIIGVLVFSGWQLLTPPNVTIERRVDTTGTRQMTRKPSASDILSWDDTLRLSEKQKAALTSLNERQRLELAPIEAEIDQAMEEFKAIAGGDGRHSLAQIQSAATPISKLSVRKREVIQRYAKESMSILDTSQSAQALAQFSQTRVPAQAATGRKERQ